MNPLKQTDPEINQLLTLEAKRQRNGLELIPSENYVSTSVLKAMGSILTNKYSEGYAHKRYYGGNQYIDEIELLAIERAKKLFGVEHVNVQPYSGSPANLAVTMAVCAPKDTVMGLNLPDGGHLTHGRPVSATGTFFNSIPYHVTKDGRINFKELKRLILKHRPKLIWVGVTAYVYQFDYPQFAELAKDTGAYLVADIAHIAGLIIARSHPNPVPYVDIVTTTTHKTLRGPRGGMIMVTKRGMKKDPLLAQKIDKAIFPGLQGGPHDATTAAIAVALKEAARPQFKRYGQQIVRNAKTLSTYLQKYGLTLVGNTTQNHLMLVDLVPTHGSGAGFFAQYALDQAGITLNKNTIPFEPSSPFYPSGIRLGTPALTTRGMVEKDMKTVASFIIEVTNLLTSYRLPEEKQLRQQYLSDFKQQINQNKQIKNIKKEVTRFARQFPIYNWE